ncbi:hypothetical protein J2X32_004203, partial [Rheinheimera pacifica]|uniref:phosphopantetheine-binding protein n=1 Tax=Rheinheimera pacifica TaxID=173990 RepID=UPI00285940E6
RKALPAVEVQAGEYEAPQGETEQALAQLWQQLLGVEQVSRYANFFMLGGHSLLVTRLLKQINACFKTNLNLQDALVCPTLLTQAELIETRQWLQDSTMPASNNVEVLTL